MARECTTEPLTTQRTDVQQDALKYLDRKWSVIPIEWRGKRPLVAWTEFQERRATPEEVTAWFSRWPRANIGIVTGAISALVVLDIDSSHGGQTSLAKLEIENGNLPDTIEAATGGGGRHLYFAHPGGFVHNRVGLAAGVDVRGDGGCVVASPSVHPSGKRYAWVRGHSPEDISPARLPSWLSAMILGGPRSGHGTEYWRSLVREGVKEGARNNTIASLAGHLLHRGVDTEVALELLIAWNRARCRPPLSDQEVSNVVESIARLHRREEASS